MTIDLTSYFQVVCAAREHQYFEDFKTIGRLSSDTTNGYQARMTALSNLLDDGFIRLENGVILLGTLNPAAWLVDGLLNGDVEPWGIYDAYPQRCRKFHSSELDLAKLGREGEDFVVAWLKEHLDIELHSFITHTSLVDDFAGYDISAPCFERGTQMLLEVKTTVRPGDAFQFHLSRNEWRIASGNRNWYLILVKKIRGVFEFFGYLDSQSLIDYYPRDRHVNFRWTSVEGKIGQDDVFNGFPGTWKM